MTDQGPQGSRGVGVHHARPAQAPERGAAQAPARSPGSVGADQHEARDHLPIRAAAGGGRGNAGRTPWRRVVPGIWFLALVLPVGMWLLFSTPPYQGLDEVDHFYRTYTIAQGELVTQWTDGKLGGFVPTCVADYQNLQFRHASYPGPFNRANFSRQPVPCTGSKTFAQFPNSAFYSPVSYLPQALGVFVARVLGAPVPILFYTGRVAAFLAFLGLVFAALQITSRAHALIFVVGAWPMTLLVATTYSADTMVIGLALLTIAAVLRARDEPEAWWPAATAFGAVLTLSLCKSTYFVLAPLLLLTPAGMFARQAIRWAVKVGAIGVVGLATLGWYEQVKDVTIQQIFPPGAINAHEQLMVILHRPLWFGHFLVDEVFSQSSGYPTWETFGAQIGFFRHFDQGDPFAPPWVLLLGVVLVVVAYTREARALRWSWSGALQASLPIALVVVNFLAIFIAIWVEATPVGQLYVGLQGRYFLPLVCVPFLSLAIFAHDPPRLRRVLPFVPFLAAMQAWLLYDVYLAFYR